MMNRRVVETTLHVRYAETDQMGVVHHSAYIVWFEEGRSAWMRAMGSDYAELEASGLNLAISEVNARYIAPALFGRQVTVRSWIEAIRSRTVKICYEVVDAESRQTLATGCTRHICIDRQGKITRIPERWRKLFGGQSASRTPKLAPKRGA